jgi:hypothetical protein
MKAIKTIMLLAVIGITATQAKARNAYINYKLKQALSVTYTTTLAPPVTAISMAAIPKHNECLTYKRKMIAGWVMFPVGVGAIIGGGYMMYTAAVNVQTRLNESEDNVVTVTNRDKTLFIAGGVTTLLGLVIAPTGLGMGINSTIKYKRRCNARALNFAPTTRNGLGFAMRF